MPRHRRHSHVPLAALIDQAVTLAFRPLLARRRRRLARSLQPIPRTSPPSIVPPSPLDRFPPHLRAYCARFPTIPDWMDPTDVVLGVDPDRLPCMADAELGEQPWSSPFAFSGPPDDNLSD
jgi:hypothetical protein